MTRQAFEKTPSNEPASNKSEHHTWLEDIRKFCYSLTWFDMYADNTNQEEESEWCCGTYEDVMFDMSGITDPVGKDPRKGECIVYEGEPPAPKFEPDMWEDYYDSGLLPFWLSGMDKGAPTTHPYDVSEFEYIETVTGYGHGENAYGSGPIVWYDGDWESQKTITDYDNVNKITASYNSSTDYNHFQVGMPLRLYNEAETINYVYRIKEFTIDGSDIIITLQDQWERDIDSIPFVPAKMNCNFGGEFYVATGFWYWRTYTPQSKDSEYYNSVFNLEAIPPRGGEWSADEVEYGYQSKGGWARLALPNKYSHFDFNSHSFVVGHHKRGSSSSGGYDYGVWKVKTSDLFPSQTDPKEATYSPIEYTNNSNVEWYYGSKVDKNLDIYVDPEGLKPHGIMERGSYVGGCQKVYYPDNVKEQYCYRYHIMTDGETSALDAGIWDRILPTTTIVQVYGGRTSANDYLSAITESRVSQSYLNYLQWLISTNEWKFQLQVDVDFKNNFVAWLNWKTGGKIIDRDGEGVPTEWRDWTTNDWESESGVFPDYAPLNSPYWGCNESGWELILKKIFGSSCSWWLDTETPYNPTEMLNIREIYASYTYSAINCDQDIPYYWPAKTIESTTYIAEKDHYFPLAKQTWRRCFPHGPRIPGVIYADACPECEEYSDYDSLTKMYRPEYEYCVGSYCRMWSEQSNYSGGYRIYWDATKHYPFPKTQWVSENPSDPDAEYVGTNTFIYDTELFTTANTSDKSYVCIDVEDTDNKEKYINGDKTEELKVGYQLDSSDDSYWIYKIWYVDEDEETHIIIMDEEGVGVEGNVTLYRSKSDICDRHDPFLVSPDGDLYYKFSATFFTKMREIFDWLKTYSVSQSVELVGMSAEGVTGTEPDRNWEHIYSQNDIDNGGTLPNYPYIGSVQNKYFPVTYPQNGAPAYTRDDYVPAMLECIDYNRKMVENYKNHFLDNLMPDYDPDILGEPSMQTWDSGTTYKMADSVYHNGNFFISTYYKYDESADNRDNNLNHEPGVYPYGDEYGTFWANMDGYVTGGGQAITISSMDEETGEITYVEISSVDLSCQFFVMGVFDYYSMYGYQIDSRNINQNIMYIGGLKLPALDEKTKNSIKYINVEGYIYNPHYTTWSTPGEVQIGSGTYTAPDDNYVIDTYAQYNKGDSIIYLGIRYDALVDSPDHNPYYGSAQWQHMGYATRRITLRYSLSKSPRYVFFSNVSDIENWGYNETYYNQNPPSYAACSSIGVGFKADEFFAEHDLDQIPLSVFTRDAKKSFIKPVDPRTDDQPPRPNPPNIIKAQIAAIDTQTGEINANTFYPWFRLYMVSGICEDYEDLTPVKYDFVLYYLNGETEVEVMSYSDQSSNAKYYDWDRDTTTGGTNIETFRSWLLSNNIDKVSDLKVKIRAKDNNDNYTDWAYKNITYYYNKYVLLSGAYDVAPALSDPSDEPEQINFTVAKAYYKDKDLKYQYKYRPKYRYYWPGYYDYNTWDTYVESELQESRDFEIYTSELTNSPSAYETFLGYEFCCRAVYEVDEETSISQGWSSPTYVSILS